MCSALLARPGISRTGCWRLLLLLNPQLLQVALASAVGSNTCMMCSFQPSAVKHWCGSRCTKADSEARSAVELLRRLNEADTPALNDGHSDKQHVLLLLEPAPDRVDASLFKSVLPTRISSTPACQQHRAAPRRSRQPCRLAAQPSSRSKIRPLQLRGSLRLGGSGIQALQSKAGSPLQATILQATTHQPTAAAPLLAAQLDAC